jgi:hypothetical protein
MVLIGSPGCTVVIGYDVVFVPDLTLRLDLSGVTAAVARLTFRR